MSEFFNFGVQALYIGGIVPYNTAFENAAISNLEGIQSVSVALNYPRSDQFGWDGMGDQSLIERPTADLSFSYIYCSGLNEQKLGFFPFPSGYVSALTNLNTERNFYLAYNTAGQELIDGTPDLARIMALGNGVITRYDFNSAVGQPSTVDVNVNALNLLLQPSGIGQVVPAITKQTAALLTGTYNLPSAQANIGDYFESRPSSIVLSFETGCAIGTLLSGDNACPLQSFGFSIDVPRQSVKDVGWAYPADRPVSWPLTISLRANGYLTNFQQDTLNRFVCPDSGMDFSVGFKYGCSNQESGCFTFKGAKLVSQNIGTSVGSLAQVSLNWSLIIHDLNRSYPQFYISNLVSAYTALTLSQIEYTSGNLPLVFNFSEPYYFAVTSGPGLITGQNYLTIITDTADTVVVSAIPATGGTTETITVAYSP